MGFYEHERDKKSKLGKWRLEHNDILKKANVCFNWRWALPVSMNKRFGFGTKNNIFCDCSFLKLKYKDIQKQDQKSIDLAS